MDITSNRKFLPSNEDAASIRQLVDSDVCIIWKNNPATYWLEIVGWSSEDKLDDNYISNVKLAIGPALAKHVEKKGTPIFLEDVTRPSLSGIYKYQNEAIERGWRSLITTPLIYHDRVIGLMDVYWNRVIERSDTFQHKRTLGSLSRILAKSIISSYTTKPLFHLETIIEEISKIRSEQNLDERLNIIVDVGRRMLNAKGGKLYLRIPGTKRLILKSVQGIVPGLHNVGDVLEEGEGMAGDVFLLNSPRIVDEYSKYKNRVERLANLFEAVIEVPIHQENELIGVLGVFDDKQKRRFSVIEDIPLLSKLADLAGIIIRDQEIIEGKKKRERDLEMVEQVIHEFNARLDTGELLRTVAELIKEHLGCSHCTIFLPSKQDGKEVLLPTYCAGDNYEKVMERKFFRDQPSLIWRVFNSQEVEIFHDAINHPEFAPARSNQGIGRSLLIAPMKVEGRIVGVVSADQDQVAYFSEDDKQIVDILAKHAGMAIERQSAVKTIETNSQVIIEKINHEKLDRILEQIINSALDLTQMDSGVIHIIRWDSEKPKIVKTHKFPSSAFYPPARVDDNGYPIGLTRQVVDSGKPVVVPNTFHYPGIRNELKDVRHSCIGLPLFYGGEVIGALFIDNDRIHKFHDAELLRLNTLVNFAAAAIRNAAHFQNQLDAVNEIAKMIAVPFNTKKVQNEILSWTNLLMNQASLTVIGVIDVEKNDIYAYAASGKPIQEEYRRRVNIGDGVIGQVAKTGQPIILNDVSTFSGYKPLRDDINSELAVPIIIDGAVKGILDINHQKKNAFTDMDVELAMAIARLSGLAFKNADLSYKLFRHIVNKEQERAIELLTTDILHTTINLVGTIPHWTKKIKNLLLSQNIDEREKVEALLKKIDDEIRLVKSEAKRLRPSSISLAQIDLVSLAGSIIAELQAAFGSTIIFNFVHDGNVTDYILLGIELNVREAISNVLYNAVNAISSKHSKEIGVVSLELSKETERNSDHIVMIVKDNGVGIVQDKWENIFELGVSNQERKLEGDDWGYGLWRSKSIFNEMGGHISVFNSIPGQGSTFKIIIKVK